MDSPLGYISIYEFAFILLITFLVVGPRRVIRGIKVIRDWVSNGFRRARKSKTARKGRSVMRGLGNVVRYYREDRQDREN